MNDPAAGFPMVIAGAIALLTMSAFTSPLGAQAPPPSTTVFQNVRITRRFSEDAGSAGIRPGYRPVLETEAAPPECIFVRP